VFLMFAADYYSWTGHLETLRALRLALDAALGWIDESMLIGPRFAQS
jgi:glycogen debranching enzyme